jgi:hypothetical protein
MSQAADERAWLRMRHAKVSSRLAELKATPHPHTEEQKAGIDGCIDALQFFEHELDTLGKV